MVDIDVRHEPVPVARSAPKAAPVAAPVVAVGSPAPAAGPGQLGRPAVSVVIPAKNEAANIAWVLSRMPALVSQVVVVDGLSTDGTAETAVSAMPDVEVVPQIGPGKGTALRTGFAAARGDIVVMMDADGSMDPQEIPRLAAPLLVGYDVVKASRHLASAGSEDLTRLRRCGNRSLVTLANVLFGTPLTDLCYGFFAFRRECLPLLGLTAHGFEIETEIALRAVRAHLRIAEVPSVELPRRNGMSNLRTFRDGVRVLATLLLHRVLSEPRPVVDSFDLQALDHVWTRAGLAGPSVPAADPMRAWQPREAAEDGGHAVPQIGITLVREP